MYNKSKYISLLYRKVEKMKELIRKVIRREDLHDCLNNRNGVCNRYEIEISKINCRCVDAIRKPK